MHYFGQVSETPERRTDVVLLFFNLGLRKDLELTGTTDYL
jgi:hypothetical protein